MDLKEVMDQKVIAVAGDTLNESKYAYRIKDKLTKNGYKVYSVGKELSSFNDIDEEIDIINLCIHPAKGIKLLKEYEKKVKCVLIQPGAESDEIKEYLKENKIEYMESCILVGISMYTENL